MHIVHWPDLSCYAIVTTVATAQIDPSPERAQVGTFSAQSFSIQARKVIHNISFLPSLLLLGISLSIRSNFHSLVMKRQQQAASFPFAGIEHVGTYELILSVLT